MEILTDPTRSALKQHFGFDQFRGKQQEIIENILNKKNTFVIMPTGGGKSMCYQLPALMSEGTAIVVSPLIALMKNQVDAVRSFVDEDYVAHFLNSTLNRSDIERIKSDLLSRKTKLLYIAPESLTKKENIELLKQLDISFFAIDEAHCISEWGHDFRPEYRKLRAIIENICDTAIIALTATATPKVQLDIQKNLGMMDAKVFKDSFNRENLFYEVRPKFDVKKDIVQYVKNHQGKSGIIYCLSRKKVSEIAEFLQINGIKALPYHAGLDTDVRAKHQDAFLMEDVDVIVATIAFGMGIDKPDVRFVIHHDIPKSLEGYYQETGRAGRDGSGGHCIAFYAYKDIEKLEKFLVGKSLSEQEIGKQLLHEMVSYSESAMCRRKVLLNYFGEKFDEEKCDKQCDNCSNPKEKFEGKEAVLKTLKLILTLKERFKSKHIVNILIGVKTPEISDYKHDQLDIFGSGKQEDEKFWNAVIRQAIVHDLLSKDIDSYGTLKLTEQGQDFIKKPYSVLLTKNHDYDLSPQEFYGEEYGKSAASDQTLVQLLKELRKKIASEKGIPPYVIFQDPSLEDMAIQYPCDLEELNNVVGVGAGKARKFGLPFVSAIAKYVSENNIERPQDFVIKSTVQKSGLKVFVIQSVDRKIPVEDIANAKGVKYEKVLEEMEGIVSSGTKLNISYYLDEMLEEDQQEELFEYFMEADSDNIDAAKEEFDGEYSFEEIRLMRIKFLSEVGN